MWLGEILGAGRGILGDSIGKIVEHYFPDKNKQDEIKNELMKIVAEKDAMVEQTLVSEIENKTKVMVAEIQSGDKYTSRARPTVVYAGIVMFVLAYIVLPFLAWLILLLAPAGTPALALTIPPDFMFAWAGVVGVYSFGRTMEKRGNGSAATQIITGQKTPSILS